MLLPDLILYALALRCLLRGPGRTLTSPALFAIFCFGVFYLIAILQIFNPNVPSLTAGLEGFRKTAWTSVAFFLAVMSMRTRGDVDRILRWVIFAGCLVALYGLKQAIWWSPFDDRIVESQSAGYWTAMGWGGRYRAVGTLSGPFHLGILGGQLFGLGRMLQVRESSLVLERRLAWLVMGLGVAAVVASQTRTNLVALVVLGGSLLLLTQRSATRLLLLQAGMILLALAFVTISAGRGLGPYGELLETLRDPLSDYRFQQRFESWAEALRSIEVHPFYAYGMGAGGDALGHLFGPARVHHHTHNLALKLMIEMGMLGFLAFAALMFVWFGRVLWGFSNRHTLAADWHFQLAAASLVLPVLFNGLTGSGIEAYPTNHLMWFGVGASFVSAASSRSSRCEESQSVTTLQRPS